MRDPAGEIDEDTHDPATPVRSRRQTKNRSFHRRRTGTGDARGAQTRRGMQLARDSRGGVKVSLRQSQQGGETSGGQVPQRIRGPEAAAGGTLAQALQEAA